MELKMKLKLNKFDIFLTVFLLIMSVSLIFIFLPKQESNDKVALVYYKNELVHTFDLTNPKQTTFSIEAANGLVTIEAQDGKVRVIEETSRRNICSIQGWSDSTIEPIVCLPNELYIKIESKEVEDTEVDVVIQ